MSNHIHQILHAWETDLRWISREITRRLREEWTGEDDARLAAILKLEHHLIRRAQRRCAQRRRLIRFPNPDSYPILHLS